MTWKWLKIMKISNFVQNKGLESSFSFISLVHITDTGVAHNIIAILGWWLPSSHHAQLQLDLLSTTNIIIYVILIINLQITFSYLLSSGR